MAALCCTKFLRRAFLPLSFFLTVLIYLDYSIWQAVKRDHDETTFLPTAARTSSSSSSSGDNATSSRKTKRTPTSNTRTKSIRSRHLPQDLQSSKWSEVHNFTVVVMSFRRHCEVAAIVKHFRRCRPRQIRVMWNDLSRKHLIPKFKAEFLLLDGTADKDPGKQEHPRDHVVEKEEHQTEVVIDVPEADNLMTNRFAAMPYGELKTDAVLQLDDDIIYPCDEVIGAFRLWQRFPHRMIGWTPRFFEFPAPRGGKSKLRPPAASTASSSATSQTSVDVENYDGLQYSWDTSYHKFGWNRASTVFLTKGGMAHKRFYKAYGTDPRFAEFRDIVNEKRTAEDILMSFVHAITIREEVAGQEQAGATSAKSSSSSLMIRGTTAVTNATARDVTVPAVAIEDRKPLVVLAYGAHQASDNIPYGMSCDLVGTTSTAGSSTSTSEKKPVQQITSHTAYKPLSAYSDSMERRFKILQQLATRFGDVFETATFSEDYAVWDWRVGKMRLVKDYCGSSGSVFNALNYLLCVREMWTLRGNMTQ
ncbi:unnamed protein product [Amoebophrya sp. A120]|nr:unnamed protein product [Amoebophrya sp. A120]|eukprot:GSA120T00009235001.1